MDLGLKSKVALILVSSKGLGFACAKGLYEEGANVIICSRSEENLKIAKEKVEASGSISSNNKVFSIVADSMYEDQIKSLPIDRTSEEEWSKSIDLNLRSFIRITDIVIPIMKKQEYGRIIAITSVSVKQPLNNLVLSNTTRLGVVGFAKTLANEYSKNNILVNVVCPGPTLTDRTKELIDNTGKDTGKTYEDVEKTWIDPIPLGRLGKPEELTNLVVFLASDNASYITGTVIQVNGGFIKSAF